LTTLIKSQLDDYNCDLNGNMVVAKQELNPQVKFMEICAPQIANKAKAGQFVILRINEEGERFPLTLMDWSTKKGTISLIFQEVGESTVKLGRLNPKDAILNIAGPLGNPSDVKTVGTVAIVCGGVGTAASYPIAKAFKAAGNHVISIVGARNKDLLILEEEMRSVSDELYISTDDGSKGQKGFVSQVLKQLIEKGEPIKLVYAIGPPLMMKATADVTKPFDIKTIVSLNPIMVDGMGMCGACRVTVGDKTKFACVDGPEFEAKIIDFNELVKRLKTYTEEEKIGMESCQVKEKVD
jgi:ferredoxin--NADP+ reductase